MPGLPISAYYLLERCCGELPGMVTEENTGDWEGIVCWKCNRVVYGYPFESVTRQRWNAGEDDR